MILESRHWSFLGSPRFLCRRMLRRGRLSWWSWHRSRSDGTVTCFARNIKRRPLRLFRRVLCGRMRMSSRSGGLTCIFFGLAGSLFCGLSLFWRLFGRLSSVFTEELMNGWWGWQSRQTIRRRLARQPLIFSSRRWIVASAFRISEQLRQQ